MAVKPAQHTGSEPPAWEPWLSLSPRPGSAPGSGPQPSRDAWGLESGQGFQQRQGGSACEVWSAWMRRLDGVTLAPGEALEWGRVAPF